MFLTKHLFNPGAHSFPRVLNHPVFSAGPIVGNFMLLKHSLLDIIMRAMMDRMRAMIEMIQSRQLYILMKSNKKILLFTIRNGKVKNRNFIDKSES